MAQAEFENGIPRIKLEESEELFKALQAPYGNLASAVLHEVKQTDPAAPDDIVTFGSNWLQLVVARNDQNNYLRRMLPQLKTTILLVDIWPIFIRRSTDDIFYLMQAIQEGVRAGSLNGRILNQLAVLDITSTNSPMREHNLMQMVDTPWGRNGVLRNSRTLIYHITSGFSRQSVQDIPIRPGPKKWL